MNLFPILGWLREITLQFKLLNDLQPMLNRVAKLNFKILARHVSTTAQITEGASPVNKMP